MTLTENVPFRILNLTHRRSHTDPEPLAPGATSEASIELDATSWVFEEGHRLRLAIAGSDWPNAWPPPSVSELTVLIDGTTLTLPVVPGPAPIPEPPRFVAISAELDAQGQMPDAAWRIQRDVYARTTRVVVRQERRTQLGNGSARRTEAVEAGVEALTPGVAWVQSFTESEVVWPGVTARTKALLQLRSDPTTYDLGLTLEVYEDGELIASRRWSRTVPRNLP